MPQPTQQLQYLSASQATNETTSGNATTPTVIGPNPNAIAAVDNQSNTNTGLTKTTSLTTLIIQHRYLLATEQVGIKHTSTGEQTPKVGQTTHHLPVQRVWRMVMTTRQDMITNGRTLRLAVEKMVKNWLAAEKAAYTMEV